ncbi:MAG TPA: ABC transporter permease [Candidatus Nanoarchaeia archaeon]|nr:ABC transporter permease [Candidatus Nanoarchaeia archaeon]
MAIRAILGAKLRSFLTMLGIIIGISAVVAINGIGAGVKKSVSGSISDLGSNIITVVSGKTISKSGGKTSISPEAGIGTSTLTQTDADSIGKLDHIKNVAPLDLISGLATRNNNQAQGALILATTPAYQSIRDQKFDKGRFLNASDPANAAVLGSQAKTDLFGNDDAIGQTFQIRGTDFKVVGVVRSTDTGSSLGGPSFDSAIYITFAAAKSLTKDNPQIFRIIAQVDDATNVDQSITRIHDKLLSNHGNQEDFSALTQKDLIGTVSSILDLLATFIAAIASIALLVGGIGIMNIMLVSVTERTREIGIRKALGATRSMILTQFLIEALVLSLLGGVLGMAGAVGMATAIGHFAKITPVFTPSSFLSAVSISVGIGIVFGLAPAFKASRKRPIEALRYE